MVALFDSVAPFYDAWYDDPVHQAMDQLEKSAVLRHLPPSGTHSNLLEVGCGTGHWSEWFSTQGFRVTGIDVSEKMLSIAREKKIAEASFLYGDFLSMDLKPQFDVAIAITSLEFIEDHRKALDTMAALVRPGGRLVAGVLNPYSWLGWERSRSTEKNIFTESHFFSYMELRRLLSRYGEPSISGAAVNIPRSWYLPFFRMSELFGRHLAPFWGNFLVASVTINGR